MKIKNRILGVIIMSCYLILIIRPSAATAETPGIILDQVTVSSNTVRKGDTFTATFLLRNISYKVYRNIYIRIPSTSYSTVNRGSTFQVAELLDYKQTCSVSIDLICHDAVSNEIPIEIICQDASGFDCLFTNHILVTLADPPKEVDTTKYKPEFTVIEGDIQTIAAGTSAGMSITVKNTSGFAAKNVVISTVVSPEVLKSISLNQISMTPNSTEIPAGAEQRFEYNITANGISTGIYPISYSMRYQNDKNDSFTSEFTGYVKVIENNTGGDVTLNNTLISPEAVVRNSIMTITLEVSNNQLEEIKELNLWIEGLKSESFIYQGQDLIKSCSLEAEESTTVSFDYLVAKDAPGGNYPYEAVISYTDQQGNVISDRKSYLLYLEPEQVKKGRLEIEKLRAPSQGIAAGKVFDVSFDLHNTGEEVLEEVTVTMNYSQEIWSDSFHTIQIGTLVVNETRTISFDLKALKQLEARNYPVAFQITYDEAPGEETRLKTMEQSFGILVNGNQENKTLPKLRLASVKSPDNILPGEVFELELSVMNTSQKKKINNIKMILSSIDPVTQVSNIITVGQSNSLFIQELDCEEMTSSSLQLMIPIAYQGKICDIACDFTYEDSKGEFFTDREAIQLPISEETQLTASDVRLGVVQEEGYTLELDFYNTGKGILKNLMVDLEGELEATNSNYYVGDLQSGNMDIYSVYINGEPPGLISGKVVFTYEDTSGMRKELSVPFELTYIKPTVEAVEATTDSMKEESNFGSAATVIAVLMVGGIVAGMIVRKKRKAI